MLCSCLCDAISAWDRLHPCPRNIVNFFDRSPPPPPHPCLPLYFRHPRTVLPHLSRTLRLSRIRRKSSVHQCIRRPCLTTPSFLSLTAVTTRKMRKCYLTCWSKRATHERKKSTGILNLGLWCGYNSALSSSKTAQQMDQTMVHKFTLTPMKRAPHPSSLSCGK